MKRIIEVSSDGTHVRVALGSFVLTRHRQEAARVPVSDLGALIFATPAATVTTAALARLTAHGGVAIVVGADHQPEGVLLPLRGHSIRGERVRAQVEASGPLRKQLWARIVRSKIANQARVTVDPDVQRGLAILAGKVASGDRGNLEAQAARAYWPTLFRGLCPSERIRLFRRSRAGSWPNNLLNYGYAVLRAMVARAVCASGLLAELGLHHHNRYDPFALASDLMEPFRPSVDRVCRGLVAEEVEELDRQAKERLLSIYDQPIEVDGQTTPLLLAVERAASSLAAAFLEGAKGRAAKEAAKSLCLPVIKEQEGAR